MSLAEEASDGFIIPSSPCASVASFVSSKDQVKELKAVVSNALNGGGMDSFMGSVGDFLTDEEFFQMNDMDVFKEMYQEYENTPEAAKQQGAQKFLESFSDLMEYKRKKKKRASKRPDNKKCEGNSNITTTSNNTYYSMNKQEELDDASSKHTITTVMSGESATQGSVATENTLNMSSRGRKREGGSFLQRRTASNNNQADKGNKGTTTTETTTSPRQRMRRKASERDATTNTSTRSIPPTSPKAMQRKLSLRDVATNNNSAVLHPIATPLRSSRMIRMAPNNQQRQASLRSRKFRNAGGENANDETTTRESADQTEATEIWESVNEVVLKGPCAELATKLRGPGQEEEASERSSRSQKSATRRTRRTTSLEDNSSSRPSCRRTRSSDELCPPRPSSPRRTRSSDEIVPVRRLRGGTRRPSSIDKTQSCATTKAGKAVGTARVKELNKKKTRSSSAPRSGRTAAKDVQPVNNARTGSENRVASRVARQESCRLASESKPAVGMARVKELNEKKTRSASAPRPGRKEDRLNSLLVTPAEIFQAAKVAKQTPLGSKPAVGMARVKELNKKKTRSSSAPRARRGAEDGLVVTPGEIFKAAKLAKETPLGSKPAVGIARVKELNKKKIRSSSAPRQRITSDTLGDFCFPKLVESDVLGTTQRSQSTRSRQSAGASDSRIELSKSRLEEAKRRRKATGAKSLQRKSTTQTEGTRNSQ